MPWANGGGSTRQVAIDPPDGSLQRGFRWRVSCAQVGVDGPFSRLPGVDRSLWLVRGSGMRLCFADREVVLAAPLERVDFQGEAEVRAELLGGPCEDCNVMTARGVATADAFVAVLAQGQSLVVDPSAVRLALVLRGEVTTIDGSAAAFAGDALQLDGDGPFEVRASVDSALLAVRFESV